MDYLTNSDIAWVVGIVLVGIICIAYVVYDQNQ